MFTPRPESSPIGVPTVGRIVHYRNADGDVRAAIIIKVLDLKMVNLFVFPETGIPYHARMTLYSADGNEPDTWFWPPRV